MMSRIGHTLAAFALGLVVCSLAAPPLSWAAERRIALVVGNDRYQALSTLENPVRDAEAISQSLSALGFTVFLTTNLDQEMFHKAINLFLSRAEDADTTLLYFAGHGATLAGQSYLFPTDFGNDGIYNLDEAIALNSIVDVVGSNLSTNLVFIDACRSNPLQTGVAGTPDLTAPLADTRGRPRTGTLISFATTPGHVAYDGAGLHSPFTGALLDHLATRALDIERMLKRVRRDVVVNSNGRQVPWSESSLLSDFYLAPGQTGAVSRPEPALNRRNQPLVAVLSDTGFSQKPILQRISVGLVPVGLSKEQASAADIESAKRSRRIRDLLCSMLDPSLRGHCANEN